MSSEKYLTYRGEIKAIVGVGGTLAFVTTHPEDQPGGLDRLDLDTLTLTTEPLSTGGSAIIADGTTLWMVGGDGPLAEAPASGGPPKFRGARLSGSVLALAPIEGGRLAALVGSQVLIVSREDGKVLQGLDLPEPGTCLASDPTARWLAAGTSKGTVSIFDSERKEEFLLSTSGQIHEGAVSSILFEPDDLRFFSSGADLKLLSTHARGRLEPEDKGRGNNHADLITSMIWGPGERLYTGSRDGSIKSWPRAGAVKPATIKDGVGKVVALALATVHDRPRLVAACDDNTLRVFPVDSAGKIGDLSHRIFDAYALAKQELAQDDTARREAALRTLDGFGDARSLELIAEQVGSDADPALRLMAAEILGTSSHPRASTLLEGFFPHPDEAVRVASFRGLRRHLGEVDFRPIDLALKAGRADIGRLAVEALKSRAKQDDQALTRLTRALDLEPTEVRQAALLALESAYAPNSPEPNLIGLGSKHVDVRREALLRLYRRGLLGDPAVASSLRRSLDDADPGLRQSAFLLALHTRDRLLQALRSRDPELHRQLAELEGPGTEASATGPPSPPEKPSKKAKGKAPAVAEPVALEDTDLEPLLQASASRALSSCLRGARGLAILGDPRAFGLLLQLSRESDPAARAEVCRALAALEDSRAIERLRSMLHDDEAEVRDAAFTALARIEQARPLQAAEAGLNASHEDIRRRGLQVLVAEARKQSGGEAARTLLARALNDSFPAVRSEAFKSTLGLKVDGGGAGSLRFAARSIHPDIRQEVLTEAMAQVQEPWGLDLLLEFFNDPEPTLRDESFTFALKKTRGLEFLDAALGSRFADLRIKAVEGLVKKHTAAAQALLVRALDDEDRAVRLMALTSLVDADARPSLARALENPHPDVRLRAALALARHGDSKALASLVELATTPEPEAKERQGDWLVLVGPALEGLGELGDPSAIPHLIPGLDSPHAAIRKQAAGALARVSRPDDLDALRSALSHSDPEVKYRAAFGLACLGDPSAASLLFSEPAGKLIAEGDRIAAALALGPLGEDRLIVALDDPKEEARNAALLLLMIREWKAPLGSAERCLACLSSRTPRLRLTAARGIEVLADPVAFADFVASLVNDKGDKPAWKVPGPTIDALAEALIHGGPRLQVRAAGLLRHLEADEQAPFDQAWKVFEARFTEDLARLRQEAAKLKPSAGRSTREELQDLAFGAYVGLVREQAAPATRKGQGSAPDPRAVRVRQSALAHLLTLAKGDARHARSALPVFVQALGDPNQAVRFQAFDQALDLGMPASSLAAEALASGHLDLGVRGLELLSGGGSEAEGRAVLEQAMLTRTDDLSVEAARLLIGRLGPVAVGTRALEAAHEPLRGKAVSWLAAESDKDPGAIEGLHLALGSRYRGVRDAAAFALASKKDPAAFEALVGLLATVEGPKAQRKVIQAFEELGDPRATDALLDRLANDPAGTALADDLIRAVGRFRRPEAADRLLAIPEKDPKRRDVVFDALLMTSGHDQRIEDPEGERPDDQWEREQHPRRDDLLARLIDRFSAPTDAKFLARLIPAARWARGHSVAPALASLVNHPDDGTRREAVKALGWRLRKRSGEVEPLLKALGHRDPVTQFLAAEGLAKAGRPDGLNVLMASLEYLDDLGFRRDAVLALGELADERAFETILKLAGEDGHALQESAAEAIGHLGRSSRSDEVFKILDRQARKGQEGLARSALKGLRWLDTRAGWQLIRDRAADATCPIRDEAIELLGHDDEPASRDLLLRLLASPESEGWGILPEVLTAARRLWSPESLEPDYSVIQNPEAILLDDFEEILGRLRDRGEPARIFEVLPRCAGVAREPLQASLLNREPLPVAEAQAALESADSITAGLAARVLGRAGHPSSEVAVSLQSALDRWRRSWEEKRPTFESDDPDEEDEIAPGSEQAMTRCVRDLTWAVGRLGGAGKAFGEIVAARPDDPKYRPIRLEAVLALASGPPTSDALDTLESAALAGSPEIRAAAAQAVARIAPDRAGSLAERLLTDAVGFRRLALEGKVRVDEVVRKASRQVHYQGVVLPGLIDRCEVATLAEVAEDRTLPEVTRLGALEGLAAMASEPAEAVLRRVGEDAAVDEDLRKAAWRCLRRSRRARGKAKVKP
ncbi:HEAT repeat domain-containing protein [Tundrisphaera lichenicola]|uniref:HEAT repeat domain-containing protein n=1 Tax=Tundrisphaera lichenicola TaxID=2029860 RepID=UPI003EB88FC3